MGIGVKLKKSKNRQNLKKNFYDAQKHHYLAFPKIMSLLEIAFLKVIFSRRPICLNLIHN